MTNFNDVPPKAKVTSIWKNLLYYIEQLKNQHPDEEIDFGTMIKDDACDLSRFLTQFSSLKTEMVICNAQKYYAKNKGAFAKACLQALQERKNDPTYLTDNPIAYYSFNKENTRIQIIYDLIDATNDILTPSKAQGLNPITQLSNDFFSLDQVYEKHIREASIKILTTLGEYFNKFNFIEYFSVDFRHTLAKNFLHGLIYPTMTNTENCISLYSLFSEKELKKLKTPQILALTAFWLNKAAKIVINLNKLIFILDKANLWEAAITGKKYLKFEQKSIRPLLHKAETFTSLENIIFDTVTCRAFDDPSFSEDDVDKFYMEELDKKIEDWNLLEKFNYSSSKELKEELSQLHQLTNSQYLLYDLKNLFICDLLMGCIDEHYSKNWGVALDNESPHYIGIMIDIEGLNMPLRLHIHEEKLKKFLKSYTGQTIMPLYKGQNDTMFINSPVLAPLCKQQVNYIKQELQKTPTLSPQTLNYLRHIQFLVNEKKLPPSLKNDNPNAHNAIDIETNETLHISSKEMFR